MYIRFLVNNCSGLVWSGLCCRHSAPRDSSKVKLAEQSTDTLNMEDRKEEFQQSPLTMNLVTNGSVDFRGRIADKQKTGGWNSAPFIIVNEVAERLAFYAIGVNLVIYLVMEMRESIPTAAVHVTAWMGSAYVFTLLGAFMADAYLGRFKTILVFSTIYSVGMVLLTLSAAIDALRPPPCTAKPCTEITSGQRGFLFLSLGLVAIGTGGIKPCVSSFGADQFDEADEKEMQKKYAFFNWFFFAINMGIILGITVMVYIQDKKGWVWGFGVPTASMICSIIILAMGTTHYRYQKPMGSPFTRFFQVFVASVRNHYRGVQVGKEDELFEVKTLGSDIVGARKLAHTDQYRFLDKAAVITDPEENTKSRWKLCTVTQVEELKSFIRMLPIWATTIALSISFAQLSTFFISQATIMDRTLGSNFVIPPGSTPIFSAVNALFLIPIYEKWIVPLLRKRTGHRRGITSLQRMGVGLFISIFAMISAAVVEKKRRESPNASAMSVFWLFPQNFLIGSAEVFTYVGQLEFFYDEATEGTRSISSAIMLTEIGIGSWLSTAIVKIIGRATGGEDRGWLRRDLNKSKLDYLYWILTAINVFNFCLYVWVACRHKGKNIVEGGVRQEPASEKVGRGKKEEAGEDEEFQNMKL